MMTYLQYRFARNLHSLRKHSDTRYNGLRKGAESVGHLNMTRDFR